MQNSKLYSILQNFDKYEQNRCRKYLQSPYFNANQTLVDLYDLLIEDVNGKRKKKSFEKEDIWKELDLGDRYDDVRFRKFCSDLLKLIESFIAQEEFGSDKLQETIFLLKAIGEKNMLKLQNSTLKTARNQSEQSPYRNTEFYLNQYLIERNFYQLLDFETKRGDKSNVEDISSNLDLFYFSEKLRMACEILSRKKLKLHDYEFSFSKEIIELVESESNMLKKSPAIALYYQILLVLTDPDNEDNYYKLKDLLNKYAGFFPPKIAIEELYNSAQNYCVNKINLGKQEFLSELFDLFKSLIRSNLIIVDGQITPWYFRNIIVVSLRLGYYDWTEDFINSYSQYLPDSLRENAISFNLAQIYFYQKKYEKVIEQLQNVEYDDITYNLNSKTILMATYYELDDIDPLFSLMESFRTYLNRQKSLPPSKVKDYLSLIKFTKRLVRVIPKDEKAIIKLKEDIVKEKGVVNANWLLEKIAELE